MKIRVHDSTRQKIKVVKFSQVGLQKKKRYNFVTFEQKWKGLEKRLFLPPGRTKIEHYFTTIESATDRVDPLENWIELQSRHPHLSKVAVDIVVVPVSSAPIERVYQLQVKHALAGGTD